MRYPKFLKEKGTIGFVAPSFGCNIEPYRTAFDHALENFQEMGYKTILGPNCYAGDGIGISSSPKNCGSELTEYYCSRETDVLISCGGGELMCEDLDFVDFERIKKAPPKWFMGYSDNTNFTLLLATLCDTASIYGPCAASFGMEPWHDAILDAFDLLHGKKQVVCGYPMWEKESFKDEENPLEPYHPTEPRELITWLPGTGCTTTAKVSMKGRLIGGCLDILCMHAGTEFDRVSEFAERYKKDGILWFMESCDLNVLGIRRALWQLEHAGWLNYVNGFLFGRPLCHGEELMGLDQYDAVTGILSKYNVPIIMDLDIGHIPPQMPLICGSFAEVRLNSQDLTVSMNLI